MGKREQWWQFSEITLGRPVYRGKQPKLGTRPPAPSQAKGGLGVWMERSYGKIACLPPRLASLFTSSEQLGGRNSGNMPTEDDCLADRIADRLRPGYRPCYPGLTDHPEPGCYPRLADHLRPGRLPSRLRHRRSAVFGYFRCGRSKPTIELCISALVGVIIVYYSRRSVNCVGQYKETRHLYF